MWIDLVSCSCRSSFSVLKTLASDIKGELHCLMTRSQRSSLQSRYISLWNYSEVGGGRHLWALAQLQFLPSNFQSFFQIPLFHFASQDKALLAKILDLTPHLRPQSPSINTMFGVFLSHPVQEILGTPLREGRSDLLE